MPEARTLRPDLVQGIADTWERFRRPGTWLTGSQRLAVAAETRSAYGCSLCSRRRAALSPFGVAGGHDRASDVLDDTWMDAVHRITTDSPRLTRGWVQEVCARIGAAEYVETVGVAACTVTVDVFSFAVGMPPAPLPEPVSGEPSRIPTPEAALENEWVPTVHESVATGRLLDHFAGSGPPTGSKGAGPIRKALTMVPEEQLGWTALTDVMYLDRAALSDFGSTPRAISRIQMELVAARTSALNECFY